MAEKPKGEFVRAGEMARLAGVSTDTLRHYERIGVLPPPRRAPNGYREYSLQSLEQIRQIQRALQMGFSLAEIVQVFRIRNKGGVPCSQVREMAAAKLAKVEMQITELRALRDELRALLQTWDELLAQTPDGERAGLLGHLGKTSTTKTPSPLTPKWRRGGQKPEKQQKG